VAVAARGSSSRLDRATVSPTGVEAPSQLPLKAGDTVRVSWGPFQTWGLVVRGGPSAQIRFAGLVPEEEAKIREWIASAGPEAAAAIAAQPAPSPPQQRASAANAPPQPPAGRSAPGAGPPPGFADRRPARPQTRPAPPRPAAASPAPPALGAPSARRVDAAPPAAAGHIAAPQPRGQNGAGGLSALFDGDGASPAAAAPAAQRPAMPQGPPWPAPVSFPLCQTAAIQLLTDETVGGDVPKNIAASARKITGMLSVGERASIQRAGQDSHFVDALAARILLDVAAAEGTRLASAGAAPVVDADSLAGLTKIADEAAGRLQKEANSAIGKGEVESLQLVTAASASLSRDLLNLKETADRLRGVGAAPRLGGHLDPDMVLPGQQPRPRPPPGPVAPAPVKAELRDFQGLDHKPARSKGLIAMVVLAGGIAAAANAFYFGVPHQQQVAVEGAGSGVQRIAVSGTSAVVTVTPEWLAAPDANLARLLRVLRAQKVTKALLTLPNGSSAGIVDVAAGKASGLPASPQK